MIRIIFGRGAAVRYVGKHRRKKISVSGNFIF